MQIIWHGQFCFQIIIQKGKNDLVNIIIDPFNEKIGLKAPKLEADILLVSYNHYDHNNIKIIKGNPFLINSPGEYEIKKVYIQGIDSCYDSLPGKERRLSTIYIIEIEGVRICHLGGLDQKELTAEQVEKIGDIDILMLPIGGIDTIDAKKAIKIMSQIEPKVGIPMHYQIPKLKIKINSLDEFLKAVGIKSIEPLAKLSIKKKNLSEEKSKIIVLKTLSREV